jgi:hypothetical protein
MNVIKNIEKYLNEAKSKSQLRKRIIALEDELVMLRKEMANFGKSSDMKKKIKIGGKGKRSRGREDYGTCGFTGC